MIWPLSFAGIVLAIVLVLRDAWTGDERFLVPAIVLALQGVVVLMLWGFGVIAV